jgi:hypothetical protein
MSSSFLLVAAVFAAGSLTLECEAIRRQSGDAPDAPKKDKCCCTSKYDIHKCREKGYVFHAYNKKCCSRKKSCAGLSYGSKPMDKCKFSIAPWVENINKNEDLPQFVALSALVHDGHPNLSIPVMLGSAAEHYFEGWGLQFTVIDHTHFFGGVDVDFAKIYTKDCDASGHCQMCAIAFTASVTQWDFIQDVNLATAQFCGLDNVHGGFVDEIRGYMTAENWKIAMSWLNYKRCAKTYATGTSLGGAVAELFAFCANKKDANDDKVFFPEVSDVIPVTFGAPAVAKVPLYNGVPNRSFKGVRVVIQQEHHRNLSLEASRLSFDVISAGLREVKAPAPVQKEINDLRNRLSSMVGHEYNVAKDTYIEAHFGEAIKALSSSLIPQLTKSAYTLFKQYPDFIKTFKKVTDKYQSEFEFEFDAAPTMLSQMGWYHPLIPYWPIPNPLGRDPPHPVIVGTIDEAQPRSDNLLVFIATLAGLTRNEDFRKGIPNHNLCCYLSGLTGSTDCEGFKCYGPTWR